MKTMGKSFASQEGRERKPAFAGRFYEAEPERLKAEVDCFLADAQTEGAGDVQAVIVPHAGYVFSGGIAGKAFAQIAPKTRYERIFLLGPSHRAAFDGVSVDGGCDDYATPLGKVAVDREVCQELSQKGGMWTYLPEAHRKEHALEVELPFLQARLEVMPPIVPIVVGTQDRGKLEQAAKELQPYFTPENLFVISSDFSHYPSYEDAVRVDKATGDAIQYGSVDAFLKVIAWNADSHVRHLVTSACGQAPIAVLLMMMRQAGGLKMEHLGYCNSGDSVYGGADEVVGYHAFAVKRVSGVPDGKADLAEDSSRAFSLTGDEKRYLLEIARKSMENVLEEDSVPLQYDKARLTDRLRMECGAFVTLHLQGKLRGCIGHLEGSQPLYLTVAEMAHAAAFEDPRFMPVSRDELSAIQIEISVLSPLRKIHSADEFQLGRHGILIVKGNRHGTFLPQVAGETHWTKEEFLGHCARDKAGLSWDGWKDAELYVYEAEVFHEGEV